MVQMGTGAMDTATPIKNGGNDRNATATGSSLMAGTFVKRSKRSLRNITENFIQPLIRKILWRRMQYDTARYPQDFQFRVVGTLGIVAREMEQMQMTQMLGLVEPGSATQRTIVASIFDSSASPYKAEMAAALEADSKPDPEAQAAEKQMRDMQMQGQQIALVQAQADLQGTFSKNKLIEADILKRLAEVEKLMQEPGVQVAKLKLEQQRLIKELGELQEFSRQNDIAFAKILVDSERGKNDNRNQQGASQPSAT
jgi:hypothetical protein